MVAANLKRTKTTILLSLNAAAILVAGVIIGGAILLKDGGLDFKVVSARDDVVDGEIAAAEMLDAKSNAYSELTEAQKEYVTSVRTMTGVDSTPVPAGELWGEKSITMYETANFDLCVGGDLSDLGEMYWQTSDTSVIAGFYNGARTWLGSSDDTCRFPLIAGTGRVTVTAGTYDGTRKDSIEVIVMETPKTKWEYEVLSLVNQERVRNGLPRLSWGDTCAEAAEIRAKEASEVYAHSRPDGASWSTACEEPASGGPYTEGENLVVGNSAVSPETTVATWMNSEKHRENILNPEFTKLAVGFYFDPASKYKTHWSQYFSNF